MASTVLQILLGSGAVKFSFWARHTFAAAHAYTICVAIFSDSTSYAVLALVCEVLLEP